MSGWLGCLAPGSRVRDLRLMSITKLPRCGCLLGPPSCESCLLRAATDATARCRSSAADLRAAALGAKAHVLLCLNYRLGVVIFSHCITAAAAPAWTCGDDKISRESIGKRPRRISKAFSLGPQLLHCKFHSVNKMDGEFVVSEMYLQPTS